MSNKTFIDSIFSFGINLAALAIPFRERRHSFRKKLHAKSHKISNNLNALWQKKLQTFNTLKRACSRRKDKYDIIISLGDRCQISQQMRYNYLQIHTYPFDWLRKGGINTIMELLQNNFNTFLNRENLVKLGVGQKHLVVYDKKTEFEIIHDFAYNEIDDDYNTVMNRYKRRVSRFNQRIKSSKKILFIYRNDDATDAQLLKLKSIIDVTYPRKNIRILWVVAKSGCHNIKKYLLAENIYKCIFDADAFYGQWETSAWEGNEFQYSELFENIALTPRGCIKEILNK